MCKCALRRIGLAETVLAEATCGTIRLKLLKIGALVRVSPYAASKSPSCRPVQLPTNGALPLAV